MVVLGYLQKCDGAGCCWSWVSCFQFGTSCADKVSSVRCVASCMWCLTSSSTSCCNDWTLREELKEAEGLLVGLGQGDDGAAPIPRASEMHTLPAEAPHSVAARVQAAGLPTRRPASPVRQRVPAQADDAAPVDAQNPAGHPAEIC